MNILTVIFFLLTGSHAATVHYSVDTVKPHKKTIAQVLDKHTEKWLKIPGVTGTGEGKSNGKPCIMIMTNGNLASIKKKIPKTVEGYDVIFEETGEIQAR